MFQCVAVCCSVTLSVLSQHQLTKLKSCCRVLQCVAAWCSVMVHFLSRHYLTRLNCAAECCSALKCVAVWLYVYWVTNLQTRSHVAACCSVVVCLLMQYQLTMSKSCGNVLQCLSYVYWDNVELPSRPWLADLRVVSRIKMRDTVRDISMIKFVREFDISMTKLDLQRTTPAMHVHIQNIQESERTTSTYGSIGYTVTHEWAVEFVMFRWNSLREFDLYTPTPCIYVCIHTHTYTYKIHWSQCPERKSLLHIFIFDTENCRDAYMYTRECTHFCMRARMLCMHACYMHACVHSCVCACMRVYMHARVHACVCTCMRVYKNACVHACGCTCITFTYGLIHV